jgi:hypothetical protein
VPSDDRTAPVTTPVVTCACNRAPGIKAAMMRARRTPNQELGAKRA